MNTHHKSPTIKKRTIIEPFRIKMIEPLAMTSRKDRQSILKEAGHNLFLVDAANVTFDFLTDSGTTAMSAEQWGAMMVADESYAGSRSFKKFKNKINEVMGFSHVVPTHQGRAAERILMSVHGKPGMKIPSNNHFDTTRANIEAFQVEAVDLVIEEGKKPNSTHPFKGNIDLIKLEKFCSENKTKIPFGMITITNNTGGGQPVSLDNIRGASEIYHRFGIPFIIDACRYAENSYFIKLREPGYENTPVKEIAREIFDLADGCLMSAKKDALVNIGGFIALRSEEWIPAIRNQLILTEGFPTYGGLAARDIEAMTVGIDEGLDETYLEYRIAVSRYMAEGLNKIGIPTLQPPGGHAIYIDAKSFLPHISSDRFPGQSLVCEMYLNDGVRSCEIGSAMFGKTIQGKFQPATMELVRMAFPRRAYTQSHFDYVIEGMEEIVNRKEEMQGLKLTYDPPFLRHFTARFEYL